MFIMKAEAGQFLGYTIYLCSSNESHGDRKVYKTPLSCSSTGTTADIYAYIYVWYSATRNTGTSAPSMMYVVYISFL